MTRPPELFVQPCTPELFPSVKELVKELDLDDRELSPEQFLVVADGDTILGFGRMRRHKEFGELCSLGVPSQYRSKGIGSEIIKALSQAVSYPLYLVCIIPDFFTELGFSICNEYPEAIQQKLDYCTLDLPVEERYVVMKKLPDQV